jgi:hypothetical protein
MPFVGFSLLDSNYIPRSHILSGSTRRHSLRYLFYLLVLLSFIEFSDTICNISVLGALDARPRLKPGDSAREMLTWLPFYRRGGKLVRAVH